MKIQIALTDTNGKTWLSDTSDDLLSYELKQVRELFEDFSALTTLSIEIDETKHYFNPAHVLMAVVHEEATS